MIYNDWNGDGTDWRSLDEAASFLGDYCSRWARLGGQTKEKFGTIRFYASFGYISLHTLIYPGYHYSRFPKWLWELDIDYISPALCFLFEKPFILWQQVVYNRAYQKALKKWPQFRKPLLCGADWPELIKGATRVEGNRTHIIDWDGSIMSTWVRINSSSQQ